MITPSVVCRHCLLQVDPVCYLETLLARCRRCRRDNITEGQRRSKYFPVHMGTGDMGCSLSLDTVCNKLTQSANCRHCRHAVHEIGIPVVRHGAPHGM